VAATPVSDTSGADAATTAGGDVAAGGKLGASKRSMDVRRGPEAVAGKSSIVKSRPRFRKQAEAVRIWYHRSHSTLAVTRSASAQMAVDAAAAVKPCLLLGLWSKPRTG
jgi:hypothetical protein